MIMGNSSFVGDNNLRPMDSACNYLACPGHHCRGSGYSENGYSANSISADTPEGKIVGTAKKWWTEQGSEVNWHPSNGICDP